MVRAGGKGEQHSAATVLRVTPRYRPTAHGAMPGTESAYGVQAMSVADTEGVSAPHFLCVRCVDARTQTRKP
eukprot:3933794-Rhodomonas_salina.2